MLLRFCPAIQRQRTNLPQGEVDRIIKAFTDKESRFRQALNEYSFKRDAIIQSMGMGGQITGEYHRVSLFTFDNQGNRYEKINFFPMPSFQSVTQEDLEDLGGIQPFALEPAKIPQYDFKYVGKEKIDELNLYVFDVTPKVIPDPKKSKERLFSGRVWVEDQDLQIVKTKGKGVPETKRTSFPPWKLIVSRSMDVLVPYLLLCRRRISFRKWRTSARSHESSLYRF